MKTTLGLLAPAWILAGLATAHPALAQGTPVGPEFRVNTSTGFYENSPAVGRNASGAFVVVWRDSFNSGSSNDIFGQRYASSGAPLGVEFRVNTYTTGNQYGPAVALDPAGDFIVVWFGAGQDPSGSGVSGQRYASSGAPLGGEFLVNTYTTGGQGYPAIASDPSSNFVVVWRFGPKVFGQRYQSSGAALGGEFQVSTTPNGPGFNAPAVAVDTAGDFVVAWIARPGANYAVVGQRFGSSGAPLGTEFTITSTPPSNQHSPAVASSSTGDFVVSWEQCQYCSFPATFNIVAQRFASSGAALGTQFQVNAFTTGNHIFPSAAADSSGNFVIVWQSYLQDGSHFGIFGKRYASSGAPLAGEFQVNTFTTSAQYTPRVASDSAGNFVVAWASFDQADTFSEGDVYAQRYAQIVPVELIRFTAE